MAANGVPQGKALGPKVFGQTLSNGEIALGATLLPPFVPSTIAKDIWRRGVGLSLVVDGLTSREHERAD